MILISNYNSGFEIIISKCGNESLVNNQIVNSFIESTKLKLGQAKCSKMHIGKPNPCCPKLKVHGFEMKSSKLEKYLGDLISSNGSNKENIEARKAPKWYSI